MIWASSFLRRSAALLLLFGLIASAFAANYTVTPSAGTGGTISPATAQSVFPGAFTTFTATPDAGYVVDQWSVNGTVATDADGSLSFSDGPVNANETVKVTFKKAPQTSSWVPRWTDSYANTSVGTYVNYVDTFDGAGNAYLVQLYTPAAKNSTPEFVIRELSPYGSQMSSMIVSVPALSKPVGFAVDRMGDRFLLSNQLSPTNGGTAVLQGWDLNWKPTFNLTLPKPTGNGTYAGGLGLTTDSQNNIYTAESVQGIITSGYQAVYSKYDRTGTLQFTNSASFYTNYAQFGTFGQCSFIGYDYNSTGTLLGSHAAVFEPHAGAITYQWKVSNLSNTQYYFGGGNFDPQGDYFLNYITDTTAGATSQLITFGPTFAKLSTATVPGFAWFGAANSPYQAFVWGSSDAYNSTGQFMALNVYGQVQWNSTTYGDAINGFSPRAQTGTLQDSSGNLTVVQWNKDTGQANPLMAIDAPPGFQSGDLFVPSFSNGCDCCCCSCFGGTSYIVALTYALGGADRAPTTTAKGQFAAYVLAFRDGASLSTLAVPASVVSGSTFSATIGANVPLTEGEIYLSLSATNGTFSNGLATSNDAIGAPDEHIGVSIKAAATNVAENLTLSVKAQGVLRVATVKVVPPAISSITIASPVTAATATTDAYKVYLNGIAGTGGVGVTVTSSNTAVIPNASATAPAGGAIASGSLTVNKVTAQTTVTLTFKTSTGSSVTKQVVVNP